MKRLNQKKEEINIYKGNQKYLEFSSQFLIVKQTALLRKSASRSFVKKSKQNIQFLFLRSSTTPQSFNVINMGTLVGHVAPGFGFLSTPSPTRAHHGSQVPSSDTQSLCSSWLAPQPPQPWNSSYIGPKLTNLWTQMEPFPPLFNLHHLLPLRSMCHNLGPGPSPGPICPTTASLASSFRGPHGPRRPIPPFATDFGLCFTLHHSHWNWAPPQLVGQLCSLRQHILPGFVAYCDGLHALDTFTHTQRLLHGCQMLFSRGT